MRDYIRANMLAYEATAEEFQTKKAVRIEADKPIAERFKGFLNSGDRVLELGTGSGQLAHLLCQRGLVVDAIEYSPKMAELAALTAPDATIIVDEFINHDFNNTHYSGIIGIAFIHLFTQEDAMTVMAKINKLLAPGGVLMLSTTVHDKTFNNTVRKTNFKTPVTRFRRHYSLEDFKDLFKNNGFKIKDLNLSDDKEVLNKIWASIVAIKQS